VHAHPCTTTAHTRARTPQVGAHTGRPRPGKREPPAARTPYARPPLTPGHTRRVHRCTPGAHPGTHTRKLGPGRKLEISGATPRIAGAAARTTLRKRAPRCALLHPHAQGRPTTPGRGKVRVSLLTGARAQHRTEGAPAPRPIGDIGCSPVTWRPPGTRQEPGAPPHPHLPRPWTVTPHQGQGPPPRAGPGLLHYRSDPFADRAEKRA